MKYVVFEVKSNDGMHLEVPFLFPDICVHAVVVKAITPCLKEHWPDCNVEPISAGFLPSLGVNAVCHGESDSLKLKSRGAQDTMLISMSDYGLHIT